MGFFIRHAGGKGEDSVLNVSWQLKGLMQIVQPRPGKGDRHSSPDTKGQTYHFAGWNRRRPGLGQAVGCLLLAVFLIALMDADIKYLSRRINVLQLTWSRYFFQMAALCALAPWVGLVRFFQTTAKGFNILRSVLLLISSLAFFTAITFIPLADANAISFLAPLLMTVLSIPLHKEQVDRRRWLAVVLGFGGTVVIIRPGWGMVHWAAFMPLITAFCSALYHLSTPLLGWRDNPVKTIYFTAFMGTLLLSLSLPWVWINPSVVEWLLMAGAGLLGLTGHYLMIQAFSRAPAPALAPFIYTHLVWALTYGFLLFDYVPDMCMMIGSGAIVAGGLMVYHHEARTLG